MPAAQKIFRFAPSPNGLLHLGHAYSALLNFELARRCGGRFLLRIEDIDQTRCRPEYEAAIYEDLAWLGLAWEEPVRRQSEHFSDYGEALRKLHALGLLYPCRCSRSEIARAAGSRAGWPRDPDGAPLYPGTCREKKGLKEGAILRLDMAKATALTGEKLTWREEGAGVVRAEPSRWGDVALARKDIATSYHIAVVVDDALQGVTDIVRGADLYHATSVHRLLQRLLNLPEPCYRHHDLVRGSGGEKLAKSRASKSLRQIRKEGASPAEVRRTLGLDEPAFFEKAKPHECK